MSHASLLRLARNRVVPRLCRMPHSGQAGVNQLGGVFINGRPLPRIIRHRIVELAEMGVRPCDISRQLLVSHGCVSKILSRYYETGSVSPGAMGGHKTKSLPPLVAKRILQFKRDNPQIQARDVRRLLIYYRIYDDSSAPSICVINKILSWLGNESDVGSALMTSSPDDIYHPVVPVATRRSTPETVNDGIDRSESV